VTPPRATDLAVAIDALALLAVSVAIVVGADRLPWMTAVVAAVLGLRFALVVGIPAAWPSWRVEVPLFAVCALVGAGNDWNTVVVHGVYHYRVPTDLTGSEIPAWMLATWGLILRLMLSLAHWPRLTPIPTTRRLRIPLALALVLATRLAIFHAYLDPLLSWAPFAIALAVWAGLARPDTGDLRLALLVVVLGPLTEAMYIAAGLHEYALGAIAGVPVWIVLWWVLGLLLWRTLGGWMWSRWSAAVEGHRA
jgi:hypothetical protein